MCFFHKTCGQPNGKTYAVASKSSRMKLSHVGIIVKDIAEGIKNHEALYGYKQLSDIVEDTTQKVRVVIMGHSENDPVKIELISPLGEDSPVTELLNKRQAIYHLCYEVTDIEEAKNKARKNGAIVISKPVKAPLFDDRKICFLFTKDHYVIELVESGYNH
ncbi:methylmalonyl-CoA epimerase [Candidatus Thorarchaeota archaeon]|nr:MAG: methylmalonyl-CoA epimerase [Candidatus Thorarchaeota archaeon]